jgi:hypothetical protein
MFADRMVRIGTGERKIVRKDGTRFLERDSMCAKIDSGLARIPAELQHLDFLNSGDTESALFSGKIRSV